MNTDLRLDNLHASLVLHRPIRLMSFSRLDRLLSLIFWVVMLNNVSLVKWDWFSFFMITCLTRLLLSWYELNLFALVCIFQVIRSPTIVCISYRVSFLLEVFASLDWKRALLDLRQGHSLWGLLLLLLLLVVSSWIVRVIGWRNGQVFSCCLDVVLFITGSANYRRCSFLLVRLTHWGSFSRLAYGLRICHELLILDLLWGKLKESFMRRLVLLMLVIMILLTIFRNVSNAVILILLLLCLLCLYVLDLNSTSAALGSNAVLLVLSLM